MKTSFRKSKEFDSDSHYYHNNLIRYYGQKFESNQTQQIRRQNIKNLTIIERTTTI